MEPSEPKSSSQPGQHEDLLYPIDEMGGLLPVWLIRPTAFSDQEIRDAVKRLFHSRDGQVLTSALYWKYMMAHPPLDTPEAMARWVGRQDLIREIWDLVYAEEQSSTFKGVD